MYCIWDHKKCPLNGGKFYCVLYRECPLLEVPLYLYDGQHGHVCSIRYNSYAPAVVMYVTSAFPA